MPNNNKPILFRFSYFQKPSRLLTICLSSKQVMFAPFSRNLAVPFLLFCGHAINTFQTWEGRLRQTFAFTPEMRNNTLSQLEYFIKDFWLLKVWSIILQTAQWHYFDLTPFILIEDKALICEIPKKRFKLKVVRTKLGWTKFIN